MEKKYDVIVVGELNVDLILNKINGFPKIGTEILSEEMEFTLGSSSAICASNLSSLGLKVGFIGKLGNDIFGRFIIDKLQEKGVDTSMILMDYKLKTGVTVALSYEEDRAMITHQGAMSSLSVDDIDPDHLKQAKHVHFSSYFFQPGFKDSLHLFFQKAKSTGATTSFDVQWDPSEKWDLNLEEVLPSVDIFIPNKVEIQNLTGHTDVEAAINSIQNKSKYVVIKCGTEGSMLFYNGIQITKQSFIHDKVIDTIGAGDSFNAGYISKYIQGKSPEECLVFGNLMGAISTTKPGGTAAFKNLADIMQIAKNNFNYSE
ncbi:carbohydrate kinase family protein [Confluentibacter flavum]|uniref:Carbohydrate kinase family protein n=1 Tax=Confluentibacter flavum TaxID=1909700 RepID=A0A2N3HHI7_9FLAO|nr:carbohydrate kinase family protein [Confluentibacter flavum]PKQ44427.1 carbohydrate kinase family protein [Confluentibacter flavum]